MTDQPTTTLPEPDAAPECNDGCTWSTSIGPAPISVTMCHAHGRIDWADLTEQAAKLAPARPLADAPPVNTAPLDDAIVDHLTRAQRHWLVGEDRAGALDHTAHMQHCIDQTSIAFYLIALRSFVPSVAAHVAESLADMLGRPPVGAMWLWDRLKDYGVDPATLTAFAPLKSIAAVEPMTATVRPADGAQAEPSSEQDGAAA